MANSVRELILENIVTTLQGINGTGGYNFAVVSANVKRVVGGIGILQEYPTLYVVVGQETVMTEVLEKSTVRMPVTIECWIRSDRDTLAADVEKIIADVRKAMMVDYTRGNKAIQTDYLGATNPAITEGENVLGAVGVQYSILYRTSRTDPASL